MTYPTVERLAEIICNHLDRDSAEVTEPSEADYQLARKIRSEIDLGIYFEELSKDAHGYVLGFRRIIGGFLIGVLALILILTTHWSAK